MNHRAAVALPSIGQEEKKNEATMQNLYRFGLINALADEHPLFIINAFALGSWATGMNVTMSCIKFSKLKSPGPDKIKIENTFSIFWQGSSLCNHGLSPILEIFG